MHRAFQNRGSTGIGLLSDSITTPARRAAVANASSSASQTHLSSSDLESSSHAASPPGHGGSGGGGGGGNGASSSVRRPPVHGSSRGASTAARGARGGATRGGGGRRSITTTAVLVVMAVLLLLVLYLFHDDGGSERSDGGGGTKSLSFRGGRKEGRQLHLLLHGRGEEGTPIWWMAPFFDGSGFGKEATAFVMGLVRNHIVPEEEVWIGVAEDRPDCKAKRFPREPTISVNDFSILEAARERTNNLVQNPDPTHPPHPPAIVVCHSLPPFWSKPRSDWNSCTPCPPKDHQPAMAIGRAMAETDRYCPDFVNRANYMDEIWVPSLFSYEVLKSSGVKEAKLHILPIAVDTSFFDPSLVRPMKLPMGQLLFDESGREGGGVVEVKGGEGSKGSKGAKGDLEGSQASKEASAAAAAAALSSSLVSLQLIEAIKGATSSGGDSRAVRKAEAREEEKEHNKRTATLRRGEQHQHHRRHHQHQERKQQQRRHLLVATGDQSAGAVHSDDAGVHSDDDQGAGVGSGGGGSGRRNLLAAATTTAAGGDGSGASLTTTTTSSFPAAAVVGASPPAVADSSDPLPTKEATTRHKEEDKGRRQRPLLQQQQRRRSKDTFVFLSTFKWETRKGWDLLLSAYLQEFSSDRDNVELYLMTKKSGSPSGGIGGIRKDIRDYVKRQALPGLEHLHDEHKETASGERHVGRGRDEKGAGGGSRTAKKIPKLYVITDHLSPSEYAGLHKAADCYVTASRGEGWGLPVTEAMSMGKAVIVTNWSGTADIVDNSVAYLVNYTLKPVPAGELWWFSNSKWAEADVNHLRQAMRHAYENRKEVAEKGRRARQHVLERYSPKVISSLLGKELDRVKTIIKERRSQPSPPPAPPPSFSSIPEAYNWEGGGGEFHWGEGEGEGAWNDDRLHTATDKRLLDDEFDFYYGAGKRRAGATGEGAAGGGVKEGWAEDGRDRSALIRALQAQLEPKHSSSGGGGGGGSSSSEGSKVQGRLDGEDMDKYIARLLAHSESRDSPSSSSGGSSSSSRSADYADKKGRKGRRPPPPRRGPFDVVTYEYQKGDEVWPS